MSEAEAWMNSHKYLTLTIYNEDGSIAHTITNSDIKSESLQITQILESGKCLSFKGCNAGSLKVEITDLSDDVRGLRIVADLKAGDYTRTIFDGIIDDQENETHEDILTSLVAYDWMYQINQLDCTAWAKNLSGIKGFAPLWLMLKFYSEVISVNLPTVTMDSTLFGDWNATVFSSDTVDFSSYDSITGEMMMKWLCQVGNIYGYMSGTSLAFKKIEPFAESIYPSVDLYPSTDLFPVSSDVQKIPKSSYISLDYEPYKVAKIDSVCVCDTEGIGQGYAPGTSAGSNCLYIDANPISWAMDMATLAADIYARVKEIQFTPIDLECHGMPYISLGDSIRASTKKRTVYSYILKRTLKGIQALRDEFESDCEQYQTSHAETYSSVTSESGKKILKIQADQVELNELIAQRATIEELNSTKATLEQVIAQKATISDLNATKGRIDTLESTSLTASNINAATFTLSSGHIGNLDASKITSGTISADRIDTSQFTSKSISCYAIYPNVGFTYQGTAVKWMSATINGTTYHYLGY